MYGGDGADIRPMTEEAAKLWVQRLLDLKYAWVIEVGTLIGQIRLDHVDTRDRRASLAIGIEDSAQLGIGLGTEAMALVLGYAFKVLKLIEYPCGWSSTIYEQFAPIRNADSSWRDESVRLHSSMASGATT